MKTSLALTAALMASGASNNAAQADLTPQAPTPSPFNPTPAPTPLLRGAALQSAEMSSAATTNTCDIQDTLESLKSNQDDMKETLSGVRMWVLLNYFVGFLNILAAGNAARAAARAAGQRH